ncbi:MAG: lamin tail domain-containing protein, partial [Pedobacter sp.]
KTFLLPKQYLILCPVSDTLQYQGFGKVLGLNPWPSLNNNSDQLILRSFKNRLIDSVSYTTDWYGNEIKKQGGWTMERIDVHSKCSGKYNWIASTDSTGGTPGKTNSVYIQNLDLIPFIADSIRRTSDSTLTVYFNKPPDSSSIRLEHFSLNSGEAHTPKFIKVISPWLLSLGFDRKFRFGSDYRLDISGLKDCSGNIVSSKSELLFTMPEISKPDTERKDTAKLYITEIFADPSPEVGLPLAEFIEIYNPGKDTADLEGWSLSDTQTKGIFKKAMILPGQYLILCPAADTTHYKKFGNALGLSLWPSFNNNTDQVVLKSFKNRTVDSIEYQISWYGNKSKSQGGWTLERIDYQSQCSGIFNWTASIDESGGTPGKINSVYIPNYDLLNFKADSLTRTSDSTLMVYFNKAPDTTGINKEKFSLYPETGSDLKILPGPDLQKLLLSFSKKFKSGKDYVLTISRLTDCSGNLIQIPEPLKFSIPQIPEPVPDPPRTDTARIIITEIFADPSPEIALPLVEFIELYNPGRDTADLSGWSISDPQSKAIFKRFKLPPHQYLIICPEADTSQYKATGLTLGVKPWPSLNNASDQINLKSFNDRLSDSVSYSLAWYKDPSKKAGGWSLERADLSENACKDFYNWAASVDPKGGTPGKANSIGLIKKSLKIESLKLISDSSFSISFSTVPDTNFLKLTNFALSNQTGKPSQLIIDPGYQTITLVFKEKFKEGNKYELKIDSLFNCSGIHVTGQDAQTTFEIPVIAEKDYPVIINEIMADPTPVRGLPEAEYVELFNPTQRPVELSGLKFGSSYTFKSGELEAGGFLILCAASDSLKFKEFGRIEGIPAWQVLKNNADILTLKNNKGREIHRVEFKQNWYKDPEKQKGGYSLELIDPNSICTALQNWAASRDSLGGSPGSANSIFLTGNDSGGLKLTGIELLDSLSILIGFNKGIDSLRASNPENYSLNNSAGKPSGAVPLGPDFNQVRLQFNTKLSRGMTYKLTVDNVYDCRSNPISLEFNKIELFYPQKLEKNDVLLTEILFNPRPAGADFVEIYNNTIHPVDLKEISLGKSAGNDPGSLYQISKKQFLMEPGTYLALSPDPDNIRSEYYMKNPDRILKMQTFPAFNNDSGTVVLISDNKQIDILNYQEKMHFPLLRNVKGISLERRKLDKPANEPGNLRSATNASGGASPGYQNSQYFGELKEAEAFELVSKTFSPDNDGFEDFIEMNYQFYESGRIANVSVFNDKGQLIKRIFKNYTLNSQGSFQWDGFDENSQLARGGIYIIHAEIFKPEGETKIFRKSFALVTRSR